MTERCHIRPSAHAKDKMIAWGIEKGKVLECILKGAKRIERDTTLGDKIVARYREFEVVYKQKPCNYFIVTALYLTD